ncbi:MAG: hypothetical protein KGJ93_05230 [Patescibacteria group bacterium]|nr:hypothetical protein [Patescibacteria group bacterium]
MSNIPINCHFLSKFLFLTKNKMYAIVYLPYKEASMKYHPKFLMALLIVLAFSAVSNAQTLPTPAGPDGFCAVVMHEGQQAIALYRFSGRADIWVPRWTQIGGLDNSNLRCDSTGTAYLAGGTLLKVSFAGTATPIDPVFIVGNRVLTLVSAQFTNTANGNVGLFGKFNDGERVFNAVLSLADNSLALDAGLAEIVDACSTSSSVIAITKVGFPANAGIITRTTGGNSAAIGSVEDVRFSKLACGPTGAAVLSQAPNGQRLMYSPDKGEASTAFVFGALGFPASLVVGNDGPAFTFRTTDRAVGTALYQWTAAGSVQKTELNQAVILVAPGGQIVKLTGDGNGGYTVAAPGGQTIKLAGGNRGHGVLP